MDPAGFGQLSHPYISTPAYFNILDIATVLLHYVTSFIWAYSQEVATKCYLILMGKRSHRGHTLLSWGLCMKSDQKDSSALKLNERAYIAWNRNASLSPSETCKILGIDYEKHGGYIRKLKHKFKCDLQNRQALKTLKFHKARGWIYTTALRGLQLQRPHALDLGWRPAVNSKNGMIYFVKESLGRLEWFQTGRINIWVDKPATKVRCYQLLATGLMWTGLIRDVHDFESWAKTARFKGAHLVLDLGEVLPYAKVDLLKDSNGVVVKLGDLSHRTSMEIEFCYPDWAERQETLQKNMMDMMSQMAKNLEQSLKLNSDQQASFKLWMDQLMSGQKGPAAPAAPEEPQDPKRELPRGYE